MDRNTIIDELTQQRNRVVAAIKALSGRNGALRTPSSKSGNGRKRGIMSAEAKRKLSLAAKARWAKAKKAGRNAL
jgi:hypothetical protein